MDGAMNANQLRSQKKRFFMNLLKSSVKSIGIIILFFVFISLLISSFRGAPPPHPIIDPDASTSESLH